MDIIPYLGNCVKPLREKKDFLNALLCTGKLPTWMRLAQPCHHRTAWPHLEATPSTHAGIIRRQKAFPRSIIISAAANPAVRIRKRPPERPRPVKKPGEVWRGSETPPCAIILPEAARKTVRFSGRILFVSPNRRKTVSFLTPGGLLTGLF